MGQGLRVSRIWCLASLHHTTMTVLARTNTQSHRGIIA